MVCLHELCRDNNNNVKYGVVVVICVLWRDVISVFNSVSLNWGRSVCRYVSLLPPMRGNGPKVAIHFDRHCTSWAQTLTMAFCVLCRPIWMHLLYRQMLLQQLCRLLLYFLGDVTLFQGNQLSLRFSIHF